MVYGLSVKISWSFCCPRSFARNFKAVVVSHLEKGGVRHEPPATPAEDEVHVMTQDANTARAVPHRQMKAPLQRVLLSHALIKKLCLSAVVLMYQTRIPKLLKG